MRPRNRPEVEALYHAALEKQPAEAGVLLDRACGGDAGLRHEVPSLLAQEKDAERRGDARLGLDGTRPTGVR